MRESRAYLELTGRDKKMDVKHSTRNKLRGKSRTKGWVDRAASPTRTSSRWARQRGGPRPKKARRRRGELWEEEEVGKSNDKFLGPGVPGVAGDNSRVWGGFDDYRFFTQQRSGGGHRYCLQISQLSEKRKVLVLSVGRLLKHDLRPLFSQINCVSINIVENGSLTSAADDKGKCCLYPRKVPNMLKAKDLSGSASVPRTLHSSTLQHFNSSTGLSRLEVCSPPIPVSLILSDIEICGKGVSCLRSTDPNHFSQHS